MALSIGVLCLSTAITAYAQMPSLGEPPPTLGSIILDSYTFDKFVELPGLTKLIKFDHKISLLHLDDWAELCKAAFHLKDFVIGEVRAGRDEEDNELNMDVLRKYGLEIRPEHIPAIFLFKESGEVIKYPVRDPAEEDFEVSERWVGFPDPLKTKPHSWDDEEDGPWVAPLMKEPTVDNMIIWLRKAGVEFPWIGTDEKLDKMVATFMNMEPVWENSTPRGKYVGEVIKICEKDHGNEGVVQLYCNTMHGILMKTLYGNFTKVTEEFLEQEVIRLEELLEDQRKNRFEFEGFKGFVRQKKTQADEERCRDKQPAECAVWASKGECSNNPDYMEEHCKMSCEICSDDERLEELRRRGPLTVEEISAKLHSFDLTPLFYEDYERLEQVLDEEEAENKNKLGGFQNWEATEEEKVEKIRILKVFIYEKLRSNITSGWDDCTTFKVGSCAAPGEGEEQGEQDEDAEGSEDDDDELDEEGQKTAMAKMMLDTLPLESIVAEATR